MLLPSASLMHSKANGVVRPHLIGLPSVLTTLNLGLSPSSCNTFASGLCTGVLNFKQTHCLTSNSFVNCEQKWRDSRQILPRGGNARCFVQTLQLPSFMKLRICLPLWFLKTCCRTNRRGVSISSKFGVETPIRSFEPPWHLQRVLRISRTSRTSSRFFQRTWTNSCAPACSKASGIETHRFLSTRDKQCGGFFTMQRLPAEN